MFRKINWDALGVTTSLVCAVHCAVLPLLFTSLPFLGIDVVKNKSFEYGMIGLAFLIGVIALSHGYRKHHHQLYPVFIFTIGFAFLILKEWFLNYDIPFLIVAVVLIYWHIISITANAAIMSNVLKRIVNINVSGCFRPS